MAMTAAVLMGGTPLLSLYYFFIRLSEPLWMEAELHSELEEQAVDPRQHEVEAGATEERTNHHEHGPEHQVHSHDGDDELAILGLVRRVAVEIRREDQER